MFKPILILYLIFHSFINYSLAQGLVFDSSEFIQQPILSYDRGIIPEKSSLEKFIPTLYPQQNSTCVAMSFAMARTIMYAYKLKIIDSNTIFRNSFSPNFIYHLAKNKDDFECKMGLNPLKAINVLKEFGCVKITNFEFPDYFPFTKTILCNPAIEFIHKNIELNIQNAVKFKINSFFVTKSTGGIKYALSKMNPVVIAMRIPKSFDNVNSQIWQPLLTEKRQNSYGHTVVAIGYDDNMFGGAIRIVNSWGDKWGDHGKIWIKYNDLEQWMDGAYIIISSPVENK